MSDLLEVPGADSLPLADGLSIGRHPDADVHLDDGSVSREHARITGSTGRWIVQDLHSRNGTWVNERRLTPGGLHPLRNGDHLRVGRLVVTVRLEHPEPLDTTTGLDLAVRLHLSSYQLDVLRHLCSVSEPEEPLSNAQIAAALGTPEAVDAVKAALSRIYARAGMGDAPSTGKRRELRRRAHEQGWLQ